MFYFIPGVYLPNTAATNRCLAYLRRLSEQGIYTKAVFFNDNGHGESITPLPNIQVVNIWKRYLFKRGYLAYFSILFHLLLFRFHLKKGDVVYCYENINFWKVFLKKDVRVYAEYTENPEVIGTGGRFLHTSRARFNSLCKRLSGVFVISSALKEFFVTIGVEKNRIHIINIIVDSNRFNNIEREDGTDHYIAYCGSAYNDKDGVDQLIQSFAITRETHPDVKLYIVGAGPRKDQECANKQLAIKLGLENSIVFTGIVPSNRIPQLLKNALVLALDRPDSIQARYGFPTKLGEYLLTGNPTVLTVVGDLPLFLENGVSTVFAKPDEPEDFAAKLNWCLDNPKEAKEIGKCGKNVALKYFNYAFETDKMIRIMFQ